MNGIDPNTWIPAAAALGGALVGSLVPLVITLLTRKADGRREIMRLAVQAALYDHSHLLQSARERGGGFVGPVSAVVAYHAELLTRLESGEEMTPEFFAELRQRSGAVHGAITEVMNKE